MGVASKRIFVTGEAAYIGSYTCVELLGSGYDVTVFDKLSNSNPEVRHRIARITSKLEAACGHTIAFKVGPRRDGDLATMCQDTWNWQVNNLNGYEG